jgi:hypothetical protein
MQIPDVSIDPAAPALCRATQLHSEARSLLLRREIPACLEALGAAERAGADPDMCAGDRWQCWMLLGEWERAWQESDRLRARHSPDPHRFWDGSDWEGRRVMLRCLHGFGDAIQFMRFAPLLRRRAASVVVECAPRLLELMRLFPGPDRVITWGPGAPAEPPPWDLQMEIVELPYVFRATPLTVASAVPYLQPPEGLVRDTRARMDPSGAPRVGIVWAAGDWDRSRGVSLDELHPLLNVSGVVFYSLQGGEDNAAWQSLRRAARYEDAAEYGDGLLPLAAVVANLDLVITIDTMAAHLAGAMGKPVWLLLQHAADWRWMIGRSTSPWYPSMRILRQRRQGCWAEPIGAATRDLARWAALRGC